MNHIVALPIPPHIVRITLLRSRGMRMKPTLMVDIVTALCMALVFLVVGDACAQEAVFQKRLEAVQRWAQTSPTFQSSRPTLVFTCDVVGCVGCSSSAINAICDDVQRESMDVNVMIVLMCRSGIEGRAFRKYFRNADVAIDSTGTAIAAFGASKRVADLFVVDSSGAIAFEMSDVQHGCMDTLPRLRALRVPGSSLGRASSVRIVRKLNEDDDFSMITLTQPVCDNRGRVWMIEPKHDVLVTFDLRDTTGIRTISFEDRLGRHFQLPSQDTAIWNFLVSRYAPLVGLHGIVFPARHDTLVMLGTLFVGWDTVVTKGKKTYAMRRESCFITVADTAIISVQRLGSWSYVTAAPFVELSAGKVACPGLWLGSLDGKAASPDTAVTTSDPHGRDSTVALLVMDVAHGVSPAVRAPELDSMAQRTVDLEHVPLLAYDGRHVAFVTEDSGFAFVFDPDRLDDHGGVGSRYIGRVEKTALAVALRSDTLIVISQPTETNSYLRVERISIENGGRSGYEIFLPYQDLRDVYSVTGGTSGSMELVAKFEKERWLVLEF